MGTLLLIWREEKKLAEESEEDQSVRKTKSQGKPKEGGRE